MTWHFQTISVANMTEKDTCSEAAYWFSILQNEACSEAQRRAFALWLSQSQEHEKAFDETVMIFEGAGELSDDADIITLRRKALGSGRPREKTRTRFVFSGLAAAAALIMAAVFSLSQPHLPSSFAPQVAGVESLNQDTNRLLLTTAVGEQLTRTLNDGSLIELNTDSEVRIQLTEDQRSVYLLKGQAVFSVAHDETRPFVVFAGDRRVTALGTMFEVRLDNEIAQVTLLEGKVKVDELNFSDETLLDKKPASFELLPGERYVSASNEMIQVEPTQIESDLSWRTGRHIFVDEKISTIVEELNRYTERKIVINDPKIGELKAWANFKLGSTQSLSTTLEANYGLSVTNDNATNTILVDWK